MTGTGFILEATITKVLPNGYYDLSSDHPWPLTLNEKTMEKIVVGRRQAA